MSSTSSRWPHFTFLNLLFIFLSLQTQSTLVVLAKQPSSEADVSTETASITKAGSISEKKITTEIPNTNLKVSLQGLSENGSFYTSKDLTSTFAFTSENFDFVNSKGSEKIDLQLSTSTAYQEMDFGTAMTDSSAWNLLQLKSGNETLYSQTMDYLFNLRSGNRLIRVPMGSSDFSTTPYTFQDNPKSAFSIDKASNITSVLQDAIKLNPGIRLMLSPWSAPSFWKTPQTMSGGSLQFKHENDYADYFLKTAQSFNAIGLRPFAFTIQNEPTFSAEYPSMLMSPSQQASLGAKIRSKFDANGFGDVLLIAHDNNFARLDEAVDAISEDPKTFAGVGFHAYSGSIDAMRQFRQRTGNQDNWMTEWSTQVRNTTTAWDSISFFLDSLFLPATNYYSRSVILWNTALDVGFGPRLPSSYCENCVPSLELSPTSVAFYPQAHILSSFSVATSSLKTFGGSSARRISQTFPATDSDLTPTQGNCLETQSFASSFGSDQLTKGRQKRFGLILVNQCDDDIPLKIGVDDLVTRTNYTVRPGLTALQFSMETSQGCSPTCGSDGPDPNWRGNSPFPYDGKLHDDDSSTSSLHFDGFRLIVVVMVSVLVHLTF